MNNEHVGNIYPESIIFNKETVIYNSAHVLDLSINSIEGQFIVEVYDIRGFIIKNSAVFYD